jgi:hypothetical protein
VQLHLLQQHHNPTASWENDKDLETFTWSMFRVLSHFRSHRDRLYT